MPDNSTETQKKLQFLQNLALIGYFSLLIILMINIVWLIPSRHFPTALVLIVVAGPLLFPMRGLLNNNTYTYQWASFLSLAYFAHGISEVSAYPEIWYAGILETLASVIMYIGCVMYARIFKKEYKKNLKEKEKEEEAEKERSQDL
ncbi:MAG: DUF2069 domain-containing protein [Gammaproteobacteria bacterium]|nr:DUF2069 domain-containing protein [Gammaproteobacteria bacterium]